MELGIIQDPRDEAEKQKDWSHEELAFGIEQPVQWQEKKEYRFFSERFQSSSLSCMAQSGAKVLGVENHVEEGRFIDFSALDIYDLRMNKPGGGMWGQNLMELLTRGACLESQLPSQNMGEKAMNRPVVRTPEMLQVAHQYRAGNYVEIKVRTIDAVASVISQGKAVELMMYFDENCEEWLMRMPTIKYSFKNPWDKGTTRHGIAAVDFTLINGRKALIIDDSTGNDTSLRGQRIITEEFFNSRCFYAAYCLPQKNEVPPVSQPVVQFSKPLSFGMMANDEVKKLQSVLIFEGFLKIPKPTGNYLEQTASALLKWQHKYVSTASTAELNALRGRSFGPKSRAVANQLYK